MQNNDTSKQYKNLNTVPRRWFPLWILDRYILREFLIKYSILMLVFVILFILNDVFNDIQEFLEARAGWREILLYLMCKLPGNIRFILPISMLLGCMWTMAEFGKNLEVTAMRASGVSLFRCGGPIFAVGLVVTFINIYFNEALIPYTQNMAEDIYNRHADRRKSVKYLLAYRSDDNKRHWLFNTFTGDTDQKDVTIKTFWHKDMVRQLLGVPGTKEFSDNIRKIFQSRAEAILAQTPQEMEQTVIKLLDGRKMDLHAKLISYDRKNKCWIFNDGSFVSYDRTDELRFEASRGTSVMHPDMKFQTLTFSSDMMPETPRDIMNSVKEKDELPTVVIAELVRRNPNMPERVKAIYMTVFFYRLAFPWACFLSVFLGIPLATKNERTGSLMAIITAVGLIVLYIVTAQIFLTLGKGGIINPVIAGLAPTLAFIGAGAWRLLSDRS
ncbi:MAG: LptF/LptG family permease [Lentisphaeria bacterium]|nr:LptF/LptG family permease [Lentisphaeria bacterium]